jgi:HD-GYP domain-containing protein (c-di-GMP phosphodiesterase class II)
MDWLKEILKGLENAQELEKKITEGIGKSFVARADFNTLNSTKKSLETQLLQLQEGSKQEGNFKQRLEELERKIATEKEEALRKEKEAAQEVYLKKRFDQAVDENKWRDTLTEQAVFAQFQAAVVLEVNKGKEDKEILDELTKDKNYFLNPNRPVEMPGMGRVSLTKVEENKMRSLMGLTLKD